MAENREELYAKIREDVENDIAREERLDSRTFTADGNRKSRETAARARRVILGAVILCLSVIGVLSLISGGTGIVKRIFDDTKEKERLNKQLASLVVYDPLPFRSVDRADPDLIMASTIWSAITNEDTSNFETDEYGQMLLPSATLDKYFTALFGTQYMLNHHTFEYDSVEFVFNEDSGTYTIPSTSYPVGYTPRVEKIKKSGSEKVVTVGYVSPASSYDDPSGGTLYKYVDYIFTKQDGEYYLSSIRESDMKVESSSQASRSNRG